MSWQGQLRKAGIESDGNDINAFRGRMYAQNIFAPKGKILYVNPDIVTPGNGLKWGAAFDTMAEALATIDDHGIIFFIGTIKEQLLAPLGVQGVKIIGAAGGNNRHDDGARWREEDTAANKPLLTIREQGWEFHNILWVPETGYSAIRAHRAETASYPDSSHFIVDRCKFVGNVAYGSFGGNGIEDWGGNHHYIVRNCEFNMLTFCIYAPAGSPGIAAPLRNVIRENIFQGNKNDICMDGSHCLIYRNVFWDVYHGTNHPNTVNMAYTSDVSGANRVLENHFGDATANIVIAKGFKPSTGDMWRNWVTDAADPIVAVPT